MAEARRAQNTPEAAAMRARMLAVCLELFNEHSFSSVTIAQIALALGMNEGHLHYYFQTKQQIVLALFDDFERGAMAAASHGLDAPDRPGRYVDYLQNWFSLMCASGCTNVATADCAYLSSRASAIATGAR
ncbi:MAG: hypothetical protein B7X48_06675 [Acidiphilium sp. 34-60-192]|nr:MAG: hypothetical protein B7X48_06675 [Acidiphilium sp. 34-60-192]